MGRWGRKALLTIPIAGWLGFPIVLLAVGVAFSRGNHVTEALSLAAGISCAAILLFVMVVSGWVVPKYLFRMTIADVRSRREFLVMQQGILHDAMGQLSRGLYEARQANSRLVNELVQVEESVRAHLAGELHDTVAQTMSLALMSLADVERPTHREGRESLKDAEDQLRAVLARMRPPELDRGTLASAVAELCQEIDYRYGAQVKVSWAEVPAVLTPALATLAYRVIQESLMNAVEHADGAGISLTLTLEKDRLLRVVVSDEGPGFDPAAVTSVGGRHVGLKLARDRAEIAGGSLLVTSELGRGTQVQLDLPLTLDLRTRAREAERPRQRVAS